MSGSTHGTLFRVTTFGESHGVGLGVTIDGCPAGLLLDVEAIEREMERRRPGQSRIVTQRKEADGIQLLSGTFEGKTTGTPIGMVIFNQDQRSKDYGHIFDKYRPSHADYTFTAKYGHRDYRGGGRSSARETAARVAAGAVARQLLAHFGVSIHSYVDQVGDIATGKNHDELDLSLIDSNDVRCPDPEIAARMEAEIMAVKKAGDTIGGVVKCVVKGVPAGWGEPVFDKLHADLGKAILSINACKGFEYGSGFDGVTLRGSAHNDAFYTDDTGRTRTRTNRSGGIQGGISNGEDIYFRAAFKPVATIIADQESVNEAGEAVTVVGKGRHDPCVLPRAVPIVDAMVALVLADHCLRARGDRL
ncbi:chorismate synthase [Lewinella sp. JB7]|uniref:chorismate synthase n=1 Tax=Lewinella sp. JB7 TaxID=2962887 RepID=UPI0020CA1278|nr:chorismate synthase [Lewinella sp. JB7]MCP9236381.1 chorismate synthase [Lewinella sp. JB7]